ncbi:MAG: exodeoxyribonuclease V subunit gamma [Turneriella sp.]|nr:exodeoxyribonuclease V subunit gamma [Leptospiraceae bacterium]MCX7631986.1 exodeoxyribonuclease V subunit gamma [Turneriella sp.]
MPISIYRASDYTVLFELLQQQIQEERQNLPPQKVQTVVIGSQHAEQWLVRQFLARYGVLMGVDLLFFEKAIANFCQRMEKGVFPHRNASWFSRPERWQMKPLASDLHIELLLWQLLHTPEAKNWLCELGYADELNPAQKIAAVFYLRQELREAVLHCPQTLLELAHKTRQPQRAEEKIWCWVYEKLCESGFAFPAWDPGIAEKIQDFVKKHEPQETLYLFGLPFLSHYHTRIVCALACHFCVKLFLLDFSEYATCDHKLLKEASAKSQRFYQMLQETASTFQVASEWHFADKKPDQQKRQTKKEFVLMALPGLWRAAQILGDLLHQELLRDKTLNQYDIAIALDNPAEQFPAFLSAFKARSLLPSSRNISLAKASPLGDFVSLMAAASQNGLERKLLERYALHPLTKGCCGEEQVVLFLRIIEKIRGFRADYPEGQGVFNFQNGFARLAYGLIAEKEWDPRLQGATYFRFLDSEENREAFRRFWQPLEKAQTLGRCGGITLIEEIIALVSDFSRDAAQELRDFLSNNWLRDFPATESLTLPFLAALINRHLAEQAPKEREQGIVFMQLANALFLERVAVLFDLGEKIERLEESSALLFAEKEQSAGFLHGREQIGLQLVQALAGPAQFVVFAYSNRDAATGADRYPSEFLADIGEAARQCGRNLREVAKFPITLPGYDPAEHLPLAADSDYEIWNRLQQKSAAPKKLSEFLLPQLASSQGTREIGVKDLNQFLQNPALFRLRRLLPDWDDETFGHYEPNLGIPKSRRLRFAEDYLRHALFSHRGKEIPSLNDFLKAKMLYGDYPPEGFNTMLQHFDFDALSTYLYNFANALRQKWCRQFFLFHPACKRLCEVEDAEGLLRQYLPAITINECSIVGESSELLCSKDGHYIYPMWSFTPRNASLLELHLLLCLLRLSGDGLPRQIALVEFIQEDNDWEPESIFTEKTEATISMDSESHAQGYLEKLLAWFVKDTLFFYDHRLTEGKKLGKYAETTGDEFCSQNADKDMSFLLTGVAGELQQYFALELDEQTAEFFNELIRPVAQIDAQQNPDQRDKGARKGKKP